MTTTLVFYLASLHSFGRQPIKMTPVAQVSPGRFDNPITGGSVQHTARVDKSGPWPSSLEMQTYSSIGYYFCMFLKSVSLLGFGKYLMCSTLSPSERPIFFSPFSIWTIIYSLVVKPLFLKCRAEQKETPTYSRPDIWSELRYETLPSQVQKPYTEIPDDQMKQTNK
jgi:hypothetical protein